jgi:hypothetical protein
MYNQYGHGLAKIISDGKAASKTSHTSDFAEHLRNIVASSHGDESMMMEMLGSGIGAFGQAGRLEMSGGSFGEKAGMLKALANVGPDGQYNGPAQIDYVNELTGQAESIDLSGATTGAQVADLVNKRQMSKARDSIGTWDWSRIHPSSVKNVMSDIQGGITATSSKLQDQTLSAGDRSKYERLLGQQIGQLQSLRANAMQSGNDEVQRIVADGLDGSAPLNLNIDGTQFTSVAQLIDATAAASQGPVTRREAITGTDGVITGERLVTVAPPTSLPGGVLSGYQSVSKMPGGMTPEQAEQLRQQNAPKP